MRSPVLILMAVGLAACSPKVPDSAAGVGFNDYDAYQQQPVAVQPIQQGFDPNSAAAALDRADGVGAPLSAIPQAQYPAPQAAQTLQPAQTAVTEANRPRGAAPTNIKSESGEMGYLNNAAVSDEQDFAAVSARETIESDKARIERNRSTYTVDQPTAVPKRKGGSGPNIVEFALSTSHGVGTQMYSRSSILLANPEKACAKYGSSDLAQEAFLAAGGPERDRKTLDPDGDGYACYWDPAPFRAALN